MQSPSGRRDGCLFALVFGLALVLRLVYMWQLRRDNPLFDDPVMDEMYHDGWAKAIAAGERFVDGSYFRAPLYPALLGVLYTLFGPCYVLVRVVQAVIGSLSCGLLFLIGREVRSRTVGAMAGVVAATYWMLIYFDGELLIPTIIVFLDLLFTLLLVRSARSTRPWLAPAAGVVVGLSAIARPNVLLFAPFAMGWMALVHRKSVPRALTQAVGLAIGAAVVILPVTIRNHVVGDDLVLISSQGGVNFFIGNNPRSDGRTAIVPGTPSGWWEGYRATIARAERARGRKLKPSEVSDYYYAEAIRFIKTQPARWARLMGLKLRLFWTKWEIPNNKSIYFWADRAAVLRYLPLGFGLVAPVGLLGILLIVASRRPARAANGDPSPRMLLFPLWGFVLIYMVSVVLFFCTARYRLPIVPPLILLGVCALSTIVHALREKRWLYVLACGVELVPAIALVHTTPPTFGLRNDAFSFTRLALAYDKRGDGEKAEVSYRRALEITPSFLVARLHYGKFLQRQGKWDEAIAQFRAALSGPASIRSQFRDDLYQLHYYLAYALDRAGRFDESAVHYKSAIQIDPWRNLGRIHYNLAVALQKAGNDQEAAMAYDVAEKALRRQLQREPGNAGMLYSLGRSFYELGRFREAVAAFQNCLAVDPDHAPAATYLERSAAQLEP